MEKYVVIIYGVMIELNLDLMDMVRDSIDLLFVHIQKNWWIWIDLEIDLICYLLTLYQNGYSFCWYIGNWIVIC